MAILVPLVLGGLALAVMTIVSVLANRKKRRGTQQSTGQVRILIHAINDDRCTGCDACVAVCPTNVLDLISNKSRVLRFQDCIQCEACMWACPTEALVMFPEGTQPPPVRTPNIDENFQTAIPGQYLIGEVAGKPLVKNAANLGRAVVEHMLQSGLRAIPASPNLVDVLIVGSGPGGMSAALSCRQRGLSYLILEKENILSSTVARYPKGKLVMAEPYDTANLSLLPVFDSTKEDMISLWKALAARVDLQIKMHETVQTIQKQQDGSFLTTTTVAQYRSQRVVLATGTRGKPRTLGVPGEQFPKVESLLEDPAEHQGRAVCVVGGGDSALEAALALSEAGARVILSYRGRSFHRAQGKNRQLVERMSAEGRLKVKLQSEVVEFASDTVTLQMADGAQKRYPNEAAFVLIGADPPIQWLSTLGIHYVERPHMAPTPASDALVRRFIPTAQECPQNVDDAAKLVFGQAIDPNAVPAPKSPPRSKSSVSLVGRKFIKTASSLFGMGDDKRPIPLSEFAKRGQEDRSGQRDQLQASERTRILRMLRDEGGRHADEDSQVYNIAQIQSTPNPWEVATKASSPKQALIVGLAKATATGRKKQRLPEPVIEDEKTAHLTPEEARELMMGAPPELRPEFSLGLTPEPVHHASMEFDEATQFAPNFDPDEIMRQAEHHRPLTFGDDVGNEEATAFADVQSMLAEAENTPEPEFNFDERTRVVDENYEPRSLSEVEWDLD